MLNRFSATDNFCLHAKLFLFRKILKLFSRMHLRPTTTTEKLREITIATVTIGKFRSTTKQKKKMFEEKLWIIGNVKQIMHSQNNIQASVRPTYSSMCAYIVAGIVRFLEITTFKWFLSQIVCVIRQCNMAECLLPGKVKSSVNVSGPLLVCIFFQMRFFFYWLTLFCFRRIFLIYRQQFFRFTTQAKAK